MNDKNIALLTAQPGAKRSVAVDQQATQGPAKRQQTHGGAVMFSNGSTQVATVSALASAPPLTPTSVGRSNSRRQDGRRRSLSTNATERTLLAKSAMSMSIQDELEDGEIAEDTIPAAGRGVSTNSNQKLKAPNKRDFDGMPPPPPPRRATPGPFQVANAPIGRSMAASRRPTHPDDVHRAMRDVLDYHKVRPGHIIRAAVYEEHLDYDPPIRDDEPPPEAFCYSQGAFKPWICVKLRYLIVIAKHAKAFTCLPLYTRHGCGTDGLETRHNQYVSVRDWRWDGDHWQDQSDRQCLIADRMKRGEPLLHEKSIAWLAYPVSMARGMHGYIVGMLSETSFENLEDQMRSFRIPAKEGFRGTWSGPEDGESYHDVYRRDR